MFSIDTNLLVYAHNPKATPLHPNFPTSQLPNFHLLAATGRRWDKRRCQAKKSKNQWPVAGSR
jgi:hypothetical protein